MRPSTKAEPLNGSDARLGPDEPAGIYVHIPFCVNKCRYCDFYSITDSSLIPAFVQALIHEMDQLRDRHLKADTLYIGGGTPSVLAPCDIDRIIKTAHRIFHLLPSAEITLEANPGTVPMDRLADYKRSGVNRINIGVQSFEEKTLQFLGRIHSVDDGRLAVENSRKAGFDNIGLDVIYGIPDQTKSAWRRELQQAINLAPEHLSCYMLTYESGTLLEKDRKKEKFQPLGEDKVGDLFETTVDFLAGHGYDQYEVSNFARHKSKRSRHNQKYWSFVPYLGLGPSAHSFIEPVRCWNCRSVKKYIQNLSSGRSPVAGKEVLTRDQQMMEAIFLGLRTTEGIHTDRFEKRFGVNFNDRFGELITDLRGKGFANLEEGRCALTRKGMRFLDSIADLFI